MNGSRLTSALSSKVFGHSQSLQDQGGRYFENPDADHRRRRTVVKSASPQHALFGRSGCQHGRSGARRLTVAAPTSQRSLRSPTGRRMPASVRRDRSNPPSSYRCCSKVRRCRGPRRVGPRAATICVHRSRGRCTAPGLPKAGCTTRSRYPGNSTSRQPHRSWEHSLDIDLRLRDDLRQRSCGWCSSAQLKAVRRSWGTGGCS